MLYGTKNDYYYNKNSYKACVGLFIILILMTTEVQEYSPDKLIYGLEERMSYNNWQFSVGVLSLLYQSITKDNKHYTFKTSEFISLNKIL